MKRKRKANDAIICLIYNIIEKFQTGYSRKKCYYNDSGQNYNSSYPYLPKENLLKILFWIRMVVVTIATRNSDQ